MSSINELMAHTLVQVKHTDAVIIIATSCAPVHIPPASQWIRYYISSKLTTKCNLWDGFFSLLLFFFLVFFFIPQLNYSSRTLHLRVLVTGCLVLSTLPFVLLVITNSTQSTDTLYLSLVIASSHLHLCIRDAFIALCTIYHLPFGWKVTIEDLFFLSLSLVHWQADYSSASEDETSVKGECEGEEKSAKREALSGRISAHCD